MKIITQDVYVVEGGSHSYHRSINILFSITINETKKTDIFANEQSSWGTNMGDLLQSACHLEYIDNQKHVVKDEKTKWVNPTNTACF